MGFCCISLLVVLWWFLLRWILDSCFFLWVYSGFDSHQHLRNVFGTWPIILTTHLKGWLEMIPIDQGLLDFRSPGESMFSHELRMPYIYIYIGYHLTNLDSLIVCFGDASTVTVWVYQVSFKFQREDDCRSFGKTASQHHSWWNFVVNPKNRHGKKVKETGILYVSQAFKTKSPS